MPICTLIAKKCILSKIDIHEFADWIKATVAIALETTEDNVHIHAPDLAYCSDPCLRLIINANDTPERRATVDERAMAIKRTLEKHLGAGVYLRVNLFLSSVGLPSHASELDSVILMNELVEKAGL